MKIEIKAKEVSSAGILKLENVPGTTNINVLVDRETGQQLSVDVDKETLKNAVNAF